MKKTPLILLMLVTLSLGGVAAFYWSQPEPEPEPEPQAADDTGMNRFQTEELMRTIGYVQ